MKAGIYTPVHQSSSDWRHVAFSDESRFVLIRTDGCWRIRRATSESKLPETIARKVQPGGVNILTWTTSGCFYPRSNIGKLEEGRNVTSVAAEFGITHNIVSRSWRQFQTTGTAIRGFSSGRPRGTTPSDDRYTLSYRPEETGGRQREKSLDTRHRRLDDRYRILPWSEDCTVVVCLPDALYGVCL
ncbi:uncharacterized protein TNCV_1558401 [Trichonephila clavipes]|uniref:Uncharacterized protein n=1 Tax=Trichonephila clavipes TaxID=2585209 RepID=A0A8X6R771_TRICX|nr:uncharacterized protein TNCV_1558401 [Trichonephila clavipes]